MTNKKDDDDDRKDLTRIEDLSEFLHQDDPEVDLKFGSLQPSSSSSSDSSTLLNIDDLEGNDETPPSLPSDSESELAFDSEQSTSEFELPLTDEAAEETAEESSIDSNFNFNEHSEIMSEATDEIMGLQQPETNFDLNESSDQDLNFDNDTEINDSDETFIDSLEDEVKLSDDEDNLIESSDSYISPNPIHTENFEEVKNFAQNFSYGTIEGAGNPPYSLIIRNIKFKEEADDILALLKEFGIINDSNIKEMEMAINLGSLLVSQVSEYTAIVLAHKLRRYDLDLEVGLADEIHPSKSGENNPKGLTKKSSLKQNLEEKYKTPEKKIKISEMIITNSPNIPNYRVVKILGIEHAHTLLSEDDLSRMAYINQRIIANDLSESESADFKDYKSGQDELHNILLAEIKNKAFKEGANALLSVQFNLNSLSDHKSNYFKLTCTCTKVILEHE